MSFRLCAAAAIICGMAASASAAPVVFTFSSIVGGNGSSIEGQTPGETFEIFIVADNGASTVSSASWLPEHHVSTTIEIGGAVVMEQVGPVVFEASTDHTGAVTSISLFKSPDVYWGSEATAAWAVTVNGARNIIIDGEDVVDAEHVTTAENWIVDAVE
jgi:hypothetical protein